MNIAMDLVRGAETPSRVLLIDVEGREYTYQEVLTASRRLSVLLQQHGAERQSRILIVMPNSFEYLVAYYAVLMIGAIAVPLPPGTTAQQCARAAGICAPALALVREERSAAALSVAATRVLVVTREVLRTVAQESGTVEALQPDAPAQIIFTSGTSGEPKGVTLSHAAILSNTAGIVDYLALTSSDRVGVVLDFAYSYGNSLLQTHVRQGASLALLGPVTFTKQMCTRLVRTRCTGFAGVPSTFAILLRQSNVAELRRSSLRYLTCAGGALPQENVRRLVANLPSVDLFLMYGQTEACARLSYLPPEEVLQRSASIGKGMPGVRLDVLSPDGQPVVPGQEGEIVASGDNIMIGYWNDPEATAQTLRAGRLWTGDLGTCDEGGYITITGRRSDLIKTAGYRVHPREIEECLVQLAGVHECAVVGVPDAVLGERLVVFFNVEDHPSIGEIRAHLRGLLPDYKWPTAVYYVAQIPRTASGKVKRHELSAMLASVPPPGGHDGGGE